MPPDLTVYRHQGSDKIDVVKPVLPERRLFGFHINLADHLLTGEALSSEDRQTGFSDMVEIALAAAFP